MRVLHDIGAPELLSELERAESPALRDRQILELDVGEAEIQAGIVQRLARAQLLEELYSAADQRHSDVHLIESDVAVPEVVRVEGRPVCFAFASRFEALEGLAKKCAR